MQMFVTLDEKMCAPYSSLHLCSVSFPVMNLVKYSNVLQCFLS